MTYVELALEKLASQFENSPKVRGLLEAIIKPLDTLQAEADSNKSKRWIDTAIGKQLDGCGYIVGELRKGRSDDDYRKAIKYRVFVNVSKATPPDMIKGLKFLASPYSDVQYLEQYPATAILFTDAKFVPKDIQAQMQDLAPAAISDVPVCVSYLSKPFRFQKAPPPGEFFVNNAQDYLTANNSDIQVSYDAVDFTGSTLGGIAPAELWQNGLTQIDVNGSILCVHAENYQTPIDSDYHLTGVYQ